MAKVSDLLGVVLSSVVKDDDGREITFMAADGRTWQMFHTQDCCEDVHVEDIEGKLDDLVGSPVLMAEESSNGESGCEKWTFYKFATIKGYVTIRWYGESNGYYSVDVDFEELEA